IASDSCGWTSHGRNRRRPRLTELMEGVPMAWRPQSAAPVVHQPEGFGGAPFRARAIDQEGGLPPLSRRAAICGQAPHFGKNALVFWRATIRHDLSQRADN